MKKQKLNFTKEVHDQVRQTIGKFPAETGGILGSSDGGITIDHFYFDFTARTTEGTYTPNTAELNRVIAMWNAKGVELCGFIHSHPKGCTAPSVADSRYAKDIMNALGIQGKFFMPIVQVNNPADGQIKIYSYAFEHRLQLLDQPLAVAKSYKAKVKDRRLAQLDNASKERFARISSLYPLDALNRKTAVCIGLGGTRGFVEELARSGVGSFVLIDGDTVSATNIATQQVYASEIGRFKAEVVKERILDINPAANVTAVPRFLDDAMTDKEFAAIVGKTLRASPKDVLIVCAYPMHIQSKSPCGRRRRGRL